MYRNIKKDAISPEIAERCHLGPFAVSVLPHFTIRLSGGEKIALKIFYPEQNVSHCDAFPGGQFHTVYDPSSAITKDKYPAVLEYLPYRKADCLAQRDHSLHVWMASYGYVMIRADLRGSGDSSGIYFGEYLEVELQDGYDIIEWIGSQQWCTGKVGIFGKSWGGFNGLQIAYRQPPSLAAVISAYFTDDRYAIDVHYDGGCVMGSEMLSWATYMFALNAAPPDPRNVPDWKQQWLRRLNVASASYVTEWLSHQARDEFWKNGSVCEDYNRLKIPILGVGGWRDGYRDPVFRLVEQVDSSRAIIGPWAHQWPHYDVIGPNMDFLNECLSWWNCHLKGEKTEKVIDDKFRIFVKHSQVPRPKVTRQSGHWIVRDEWPQGVENIVLMPLGGGKLIEREVIEEASKMHESFFVPYQPGSGQSMGEWLTFGESDDFLDQREEDALALCFTSNPLTEDLCILGLPLFHCQLVTWGIRNTPVIARLCDVSPDGSSALITLGVLNLSHRCGHDVEKIQPLVEGKVITCVLKLHAAAYSIPKGHQLRLALCTNYWPMIWPAAKVGKVELITGCDSMPEKLFSYLEIPKNVLPVCQRDIECHSKMVCSYPSMGPKLEVVQNECETSNVTKSFSYRDEKYTRTIQSCHPNTYYPEIGVALANDYKYTYEIDHTGPQSAKAICDKRLVFDWPDHNNGTKIEIVVHCCMSANEEFFALENCLKVRLNDEAFFEKSWHDRVVRNLV